MAKSYLGAGHSHAQSERECWQRQQLINRRLYLRKVSKIHWSGGCGFRGYTEQHCHSAPYETRNVSSKWEGGLTLSNVI